jgi:hypothetical protein
MAWREKLERFNREFANQRSRLEAEAEDAAVKEAKQRDVYKTVAETLLKRLLIIESLANIRDEFWEVGELSQNVASWGFEVRLHAEYPQYYPGHWYSFGDRTSKEREWIPASIDFAPEWLGIALHFHRGFATVGISFLHADNGLLLMRMAQFRNRYGWGYNNRFLDLRGRWRIFTLMPGEELSACRARLDELLLDYCAVKVFMPRWAILSAKSEEIRRALSKELAEININEDALNVLRDAGLLMGA